MMDKVKTAVRGVYLPGLVIFLLLIFISGTAFSGEEKETLTGQLVLIGNEPFTRLICRLDEGNLKAERPGAVQLEGELLAELLKLQGARVLLEGHQTGKLSEYRLSIFTVTAYQLLAVNGSQPIVGVLHKIKDQLVLESGEGKRYFLVGPFSAMVEEYVGGKLWLTGEVKQGLFSWLTGKYELIPAAFGVISEP
jgi:hypothetical protein